MLYFQSNKYKLIKSNPSDCAVLFPFSRPNWKFLRSHLPTRWHLAIGILIVSVFTIRCRYLGNPVIDVDEQFYLLVGDRMLQGAVPYVDIWDRKPIGLFLLFAAVRMFGGDGIEQYQLVASAFCAATAVVIATIAKRISSPSAGLVAGLSYAPALAMSGGMGGQAPVFYNLLTVSAAAVIVRLLAAPSPSLTAIRRAAPVTMALAGIAVQMKYTAVFEGIFFALTLTILAWRSRPGLGRLADLALWLAILVLPTALAVAWYTAHGWATDFIFANFVSILERRPYSHAGGNLAMVGLRLLPFVLCIVMGEWLLAQFKNADRTAGERQIHAFVRTWLLVATLAFLGFGTYFKKYSIPLITPLALAAAPTFTIRFRYAGPVFASILLASVYLPYPIDAARVEKTYGGRLMEERLAASVRSHLSGGCLYIYYGDPILYHMANSCLPTRWAFPFHLSLARETPALGTNAIAEINRIMSSRPTVVIDSDSDDDEIDDRTQAVLRAWLRKRYRLVDRVPRNHSHVLIWALQRQRRPASSDDQPFYP